MHEHHKAETGQVGRREATTDHISSNKDTSQSDSQWKTTKMTGYRNADKILR